MTNDFNDPITLFITWTAYGAWLPGDNRGWRKSQCGEQQPEPILAEWCKERMNEKPVLFDHLQRQAVENVIAEHSVHRGWKLHVVSVQSNHVHVVVTMIPQTGSQNSRRADGVKKVRDELKANATRVLKGLENPICNKKIWTKGGDIQFVDSDEELERVVIYVSDAQNRMDRPKD